MGIQVLVSNVPRSIPYKSVGKLCVQCNAAGVSWPPLSREQSDLALTLSAGSELVRVAAERRSIRRQFSFDGVVL
jgi:hypothetical protein